MNADLAASPPAALWALRLLTVALAVVMALAIGAATRGAPAGASTVATIAWGVTIAVLVVALVAPSPLGLTLLRMILPVAVPAAALALVFGAGPTRGITALALAVLAALVALSAELGEAMVQGSAYGDERRLPLRPPAAVLLPMGLSWLAWAAAVLGAVLLLCERRWWFGAVVALLAALLGRPLFLRFHRFSRRWLVLVPAGLVLHDHVILGETLMVQRTNVAQARLAPADTQAADFTGPAAGHAIEVAVREMVLAVMAGTAAAPKGTALHVQSLLVAPSRPGRALRAIADLHVAVG